MQPEPHIMVCVTNDLVTDQRVHKICLYLQSKNVQPVLIGRKLRVSLPVKRSYTTKRMVMLFNHGPLFYAFFNLRLFLFLLFKKTDILVANDLDTLPACAWIKRIKPRILLIYDSHEIFTEVPELTLSPLKKKIWQRLERKNINKANAVITVNGSIAQWFKKKYNITPYVVRNVPLRYKPETRIHTDLNPKVKYLIVQGAGINVDRGNEELLQAMEALPSSIHLLIIGSGDILDTLKQIAKKPGLKDRIHFYPKMPYEKLMQYTQQAWAGITLDKDTNLNYRYSLPNKLFDFIQAGIPVIASNLPEVAGIITSWKTGIITPSHNPADIARSIMQLSHDTGLYAALKKNCEQAASQLCWENECTVLDMVYGPYLDAQR